MKTCMLAYTFYESDSRVIRYAEALAERGDSVDAIALRRKGQPRFERINGVNVYRIQEREKNERGPVQHLWRLLLFLVRSFWRVSRLHWKQSYDVVHVHSVPDFEVFAALIPKLSGARVILDIHDIVPEFYAAKFGASTRSLLFKGLVLVERLSCAFADHVITANHIWKERLEERSVRPGRCSALTNCPDITRFRPVSGNGDGGVDRAGEGRNGRFVILYPGSLNWHQGLDIAIRAFATARQRLGDAELQIYGEGSSRGELEALARELRVEDRVIFRAAVPSEEIAGVMGRADLGIVPKRANLFGNEAFSTKILEFMAVGVPVIVARTAVDTRYFDESLVVFFEPGNHEDLAERLVQLKHDGSLREGLTRNALEHVQDNNWNNRKFDYLALVDSLAGEGVPA